MVLQPQQDPLTLIKAMVAAAVPAHEQTRVQNLLIEELRRLHDGVLARYGLRPSDYAEWRRTQRGG